MFQVIRGRLYLKTTDRILRPASVIYHASHGHDATDIASQPVQPLSSRDDGSLSRQRDSHCTDVARLPQPAAEIDYTVTTNQSALNCDAGETQILSSNHPPPVSCHDNSKVPVDGPLRLSSAEACSVGKSETALNSDGNSLDQSASSGECSKTLDADRGDISATDSGTVVQQPAAASESSSSSSDTSCTWTR